VNFVKLTPIPVPEIVTSILHKALKTKTRTDSYNLDFSQMQLTDSFGHVSGQKRAKVVENLQFNEIGFPSKPIKNSIGRTVHQ